MQALVGRASACDSDTLRGRHLGQRPKLPANPQQNLDPVDLDACYVVHLNEGLHPFNPASLGVQVLLVGAFEQSIYPTP